MAKKGKYIYSVVKAKKEEKFGPIGIGEGGNEVYLIPYEDIAAVVSDALPIAYDSLPKEVLIGYLAAHQGVIEQVMKNYTVIPLKFGTMAQDEGEVKEILGKGYSQFRNALETVGNKMELEVVALWEDLNLVFEEIGREEKIQKFKREISLGQTKSPQEIYEEKIKLGKMVRSMLDGKRNKYAREIVETLKEEAEDFCSHEIMDDSMIINAAFLVDRSKEGEFDQKIRELDGRYNNRINFRVVGPLPPYSFSTVEIRKMEFETLDEARRTLYLGEEANLSEIKEAYRRLTHKYHPDKNPDDMKAQEQFKKMSNAYKILADYCRHHYKYSLKEKDAEDFITVKIQKFGEVEVNERGEIL